MKITQFLSIAAIVLAAAGCSESPTTESAPATAISLKGDIVKHSKATENGFAEHDRVGVYIADYTSSNTVEGTLASARVVNREHTYNSDNSFAPTTGDIIEWTDKNTNITIWGVYPFVAEIADPTAMPFSVKAEQYTAGNYAASDLLLAKKSNIAPTRSAIELVFSHALSKASVTVTKDADNPIDISAGVTVMLKTLITNATVNIQESTITALTTKANIIVAAQNSKYEAVVIPQLVSGLTIEITLADFTTYTYTFPTDFTFAPKSQHDISINLKKGSSVEVTANEITQWIPGTGGSGEVFPF